ncbi:hypothetical protein CDAR_319841 [Caerostris darwini]|uniref:Uncharacterized protein n=1 Tax=Caerostris darwini TaxID=1538125 RepID=A0AAV4M8E3_9ARAC|nr:hypothetical protein CDAR_319841 [Caerostris darwini]
MAPNKREKETKALLQKTLSHPRLVSMRNTGAIWGESFIAGTIFHRANTNAISPSLFCAPASNSMKIAPNKREKETKAFTEDAVSSAISIDAQHWGNLGKEVLTKRGRLHFVPK